MTGQNRFTVSADWLEQRLGRPGLSIVDASWFLAERDARAEHDAAHIPGAVFFDHEEVVDPASSLPHTLPPPEVFARFAGSAGISADDDIVVYDWFGFRTAPRFWWMFRVMGAHRVHLLEGGFGRWRAEGRPVTDAPTRPVPTDFRARFDAARVATLADMQAIVARGARQIIDARLAESFAGSLPSPYASLPLGHMPGARSLPSRTLSQDGMLLPPDQLRARFEAIGIDLDRPVVTTCGSGVAAAVVNLALDILGHDDHLLYDGSWSEWAAVPGAPVARG